jgi:hypothetical protein
LDHQSARAGEDGGVFRQIERIESKTGVVVSLKHVQVRRTVAALDYQKQVEEAAVVLMKPPPKATIVGGEPTAIAVSCNC